MSTHADDMRDQYAAECAIGHLPIGTRIRFDSQVVWERHRLIADRLPYIIQEAGTVGVIIDHDRFGNVPLYKIQIEGTGEVVPYLCDAALTVL